MESSSRASRRKHKLEPISVEEALSDAALTGMLSFLERAPTGEPLPWAVTDPTDLSGRADGSALADTSTVEESLTEEDVASAEKTAAMEGSSTQGRSASPSTLNASTVEAIASVATPSTVEKLKQDSHSAR
jgi:hypothetical protein